MAAARAATRKALAARLEPRFPADFPAEFISYFPNEPLSVYQEGAQSRQNQITVLDEEIQQLEQELSDLIKSRRQVASEVAGCKGALSAMRKFSNAIFGEIFSYYLGLVDGTSPKYLLQLCRVSRQWRNAALLTPWLWTTMPKVSKDRHCGISAAMFQHWLQNSQTLPVEIVVSWPFIYNQCEQTTWDVVMDHLARVTSLQITVPRYQPEPDESGAMRSPDLRLPHPPSAPLLRSLNINFPKIPLDSDEAVTEPFTKTISWSVALIRSQSDLQKLIWDAGAMYGLSELSHSVASLTHLTVKAESAITVPSTVFNLLENTPRLEHCDITFSPTATEDTLPDGLTCKMENLKFLRIAESSSLGRILTAISTPKISHLIVESENVWCHQEFMGFLQRSCGSNNLTHLAIKTKAITEAEVLECLKSSYVDPSLVSLDLRRNFPGWIATDAVLEYLRVVEPAEDQPPPSSSPSLPNLESLSLAVELTNQYELFKDLLSSRTKLDLSASSNIGQSPPQLTVAGVKKLKDINIDLLVPQSRFVTASYSYEVERMRDAMQKGNETKVKFTAVPYTVWVPMDVALSLAEGTDN